MASTSYRIGITRVLACSLLWPGCQSRLHMNEADHAAATAKMMVDASTQTPESSLSLPSAHTGKRAASKLSQPDTEEKKESSVAVARSQPLTTDTCVFPQAVAHATVAQESQEFGITESQEFGITESQEFGITDAIASSRDLAATTLARVPHQDAKPTAQAAQKGEASEASQAIPAGLKSWFQRFANAVDDVNEDVEDADSLAWLSGLIKEGRAAGYLTQSVPIAINTVGWEPNCTPLHYAAAKGNAQAVAALLRESSVVIDAKTEDQYGSTPLHFAAYEGNLGAAQLLVEGYKQRNKLSEIDAHDTQGSSPLQYAAGGPWDGLNRGVAELLVANGADPKQCFDTDITLVDLSAIGGNFAMVEYWIEQIAHKGRFTKEEKKKLIESAMKLARRQKHTDIVITLQNYYEDL